MSGKSKIILFLFLFCLVGAGVFLFYPPIQEVQAATLYEYYNTGDGTALGFYLTDWRAQTFTPATAHKITSVKLLFYRTGSPGTITVSIRATDGSGFPTGADLCLGTTDGNTLPTDSPYEWREITLGAGYDLSASTKYAIVVRSPSGNATNKILWRINYASPTYAGGLLVYSADSGSSWTNPTNYDCMFEDWGLKADGQSCTANGDCANNNCRTSSDRSTKYCASAGKSCGQSEGVGYSTNEYDIAANAKCTGADTWACSGGYYYTSSCVAVGQGYYSADASDARVLCSAGTYSDTTTASSCTNCPAGTYGSTTGLATSACTGNCTAGYYCSAGSTSATQNECGGNQYYCPVASGSQTSVSSGYYSTGGTATTRTGESICEIGYYCSAGAKTGCSASTYTGSTGQTSCTTCEAGYYCVGSVDRAVCPAGTYGSTTGLTTSACTGNCTAGYYCSAGSTSATQNECGLGNYCPAASGSATACPAGTYGSSTTLTTSACTGQCDAGYYGSTTGLTVSTCTGLCDAGRYGTAGQTASTCTGACAAGYYGTAGTVRTTSSCDGQCTAGYYCTAGSTSATQNNCGTGNYCPAGSGSPTACPAGTYGSTANLQTSACTGNCTAGYYCPAGSTSATQAECGGNQYYCPAASGNQTSISPGYYSTGGTETTRTGETQCTAGTYCSGGVQTSASAGYYVPSAGATSQTECGSNAVYCPGTGNIGTTSVSSGYYSTGGIETTRTGQTECEAGNYCSSGVKTTCPAGTYGSTTGLTTSACSGDCVCGHYCSAGSTSATQTNCSAGTYRASTGGTAQASCTSASAGYYTAGGLCSQTACGSNDKYSTEGASSCTAVSAGYYSTGGTATTRTGESACGGNQYYCSSGVKDDVSSGYYSTGGTETTRTGESICEIGYYCSAGAKTGCSASTYTGSTGQTSCTTCETGYYCVGLVDRAVCPAGTHGSTTGLTTSACTGNCTAGYYCPAGSTSATQNECGGNQYYCPAASGSQTSVSSGYYSTGGTETTRTGQSQCTAGTYCSGGVQTSASAGYYVPSAGATSQTECGSNAVYCPGTGNTGTTSVSSGYYSTGGTATTRIGETECEAGNYCSSGVKTACAAGTYQGSTGQISCTSASAGYYSSGTGNTSQTECGSNAVYCLGAGNTGTTSVSSGYYSTGGTATTRTGQTECTTGTYCTSGVQTNCPAGTYGSTTGLTTSACSGNCTAGYYCSAGSTSATQTECGGNQYYCPAASGSPTIVSPGFYSTGGTETTRTGQTCPPGGVHISFPVSTTGYGNISQSAGGQVSKTFESGILSKIIFPAQSIKGSVVAKIEPQNKTEIIKNNPLPENTQIIGDSVADFKALSEDKEIESFEKEVSITFTYSDGQIKEAGLDEKTLKIYWWDEATKTWKPLKSEVNALNNTVTAYTSHFTLFAIIGETEEKPAEEKPIVIAGMTIEELKAKIAEIETKIAEFQTQLKQLLEKEVILEIPVGYKFTKYLWSGQKDEEIKYLQIFLKAQGPEIYPEGLVSGYFKSLTEAAVKRFQIKYGIVSSENDDEAGFVGPETRAKINEFLGR